MLAIIPSATLHGLDGRFIRVEVDVAPGLPGFTIVGLADTALQEARERVRGAIRNAGYSYPPRRITVNLAPADLRKGGASLDLAMALGILLGSEQVRAGPGRLAFIGELSLGGEVRSVPGVLPMVAALARRGLKRVVVAAPAVDEARLIEGVEVSGVETLRQAVERIRIGRAPRRAPSPPRIELVDAATKPSDDVTGKAAQPPGGRPPPDLSEVRGQLDARRGLEIALAGGHGLLLDRPARVGQDAPGPDDPEPAPAARRCRGARRDGRRVGRRRGSDRRAPASTAVSLAAPHGLVCGDGRRRPAPVARRDHAGGSGRPVPRRAARVRAGRARGAPSADGGGPGRDRPRRTRHDLPGPVPAGRGHEPVSVRLRGHVRPGLPVCAAAARAIPAPRVRPVARPDRSLDRDAAGRPARHRPGGRARGLGDRRRANRRRPERSPPTGGRVCSTPGSPAGPSAQRAA